MAKKIETRECSLAELKPEFAEILKGHLPSDEQPLICCETRWETDFSPKKTIFSVGIITQHWIVDADLSLHKSFLGYTGEADTSATSMFLAEIVGISEGDWAEMGFEVKARGHGDNYVGCIFEARQVSIKFASILREAVEQAKAATLQTQKSPSDRLRELQKLYDDKLISDTEFQQKRKEILGQL